MEGAVHRVLGRPSSRSHRAQSTTPRLCCLTSRPRDEQCQKSRVQVQERRHRLAPSVYVRVVAILQSVVAVQAAHGFPVDMTMVAGGYRMGVTMVADVMGLRMGLWSDMLVWQHLHPM